MALLHITEATGGLPLSGRISGTDGDLVTQFDTILPLNGWAIEATSGNYRVYRAAVGNRFRLCMRDEAAGSGQAYFTVVRAAENFSSATSWTDPSPTVAEQADTASNWIKSSVASTAARSFDIFLSTTAVMYFVNFSGSANVWEFHYFGDVSPALAGDAYNTIILVRGTTSLAAQWGSCASASFATSTMPWYWVRTYDGTLKASRGSIAYTGSNALGNLSNAQVAQSSPTSGIDTNKIILSDAGVTSGTPGAIGLPIRGYLPNLRNPLHNGRGTVNSRDTYTMTGYNASFQGVVFTVSAAAGSAFAVVENSDTWTPPT